MEKIKLSSSEIKTVTDFFSGEKYAVCVLHKIYSGEQGAYYFSHYEPRIHSVYETKEDAINFIKYNGDFHGSYIIPITQITREQRAKSDNPFYIGK